MKGNDEFFHSDISDLTLIIREFDEFDNYLNKTVNDLQIALPGIKIIIVSDKIIYPPVAIPKSVSHVVLKQNLNQSHTDTSPSNLIKTKFVAFLPDASRILTKSSVELILDTLYYADDPIKIVAWSTHPRTKLECYNLNLSLKQWTLKYYIQDSKICDAINGSFIIMMKTEDFSILPFPWELPLDRSLFIQTYVRGWKILINSVITSYQFSELQSRNMHIKSKHCLSYLKKSKSLYEKFGIKYVEFNFKENEWYGCNKHSLRCFDTVVNDTPEYLVYDKWTPPCCLEALRITLAYVISVFHNQKVRYWLEGGSLLGAARDGDIIPWDYDVDLGIYKEDIDKSEHLKKSLDESFVDDEGFLWEKASEGDFFRIHYSITNRLHVDIFPFYSRNGTMTKDTWFKNHRQDTEFPEYYLKPRVKLKFCNLMVYVPNHYEEFLEFKFGKDVIKNPKYPHG